MPKGSRLSGLESSENRRMEGDDFISKTRRKRQMTDLQRLGADLVKLFPAHANGPEFVRAVRAPMPFLRIYPTSGVNEENCEQWLKAGAFGVGFVGSLFDADDLERRRFDVIKARAARMVARIKALGPPPARRSLLPAAPSAHDGQPQLLAAQSLRA